MNPEQARAIAPETSSAWVAWDGYANHQKPPNKPMFRMSNELGNSTL